jgi:hypothetical protein
MSDKVKEAFETLKQAIIDDPDFAYSWHCNVAMMCHDAILNFDDQAGFAHHVGNDAASRFMKLCFDVETKLAEIEPCEGCDSSPEDCKGVKDCERLDKET